MQVLEDNPASKSRLEDMERRFSLFSNAFSFVDSSGKTTHCFEANLGTQSDCCPLLGPRCETLEPPANNDHDIYEFHNLRCDLQKCCSGCNLYTLFLTHLFLQAAAGDISQGNRPAVWATCKLDPIQCRRYNSPVHQFVESSSNHF